MKKITIAACLVLPIIIAAIVVYDNATFHSEEIFVQGFTSDDFCIALKGELQIRRKFFTVFPSNANFKCKRAIQEAILDSKLKDIYYDTRWFQKKILRAIKKEVKPAEAKFIDFKIRRIYYPDSFFESAENPKEISNLGYKKFITTNYAFTGKTSCLASFLFKKN